MDYEYIKNNYRLRAVDLSRQIELDADPKAIQQIKLVRQLKYIGGINTDGAESMFILRILEKTFLNVVQQYYKVANYQEARVKLTNTQLNKLKPSAKNKKGAISRLNRKNFEDEESPHKLFVTTRMIC